MNLAFAPGGTAWLVWQECRFQLWSSCRVLKRDGRHLRALALPVPLLILFALLAHGVAWMLLSLSPSVHLARPALAMSLFAILLLMSMQASLRAINALAGRGDLALLRMAPLPDGVALRARLGGIAVAVAASWLMFLIPMLDVAVLMGRWRWLALLPAALASASLAACIGMAIALTLLRWLGAARLQRFGRMGAMALGMLVFLATQLPARVPAVEKWLSGVLDGASAGPWAAAESLLWFFGGVPQGEPLALAAWVAMAVAGFALAGIGLAGAFASASLAVGSQGTLQYRRISSRARRFHGGMRALVLKEWRLLRRSPQAVAQSVLEMFYLLPASIGLFNHAALIVPSLAGLLTFTVCHLAGDVCGKLYHLDQAADLLTLAPQPASRWQRARMLACCLPLQLLALPGAAWLMWHDLLTGAAALAALLLGAPLSCGICMALGTPTASKRADRIGNMGWQAGLADALHALLWGLAVFGLAARNAM
ncbi:hypothetical protein [Chromobacterium alticapitis]|uniref:Uncharacterized protein n=1 Tax=Chromobacterium alticapitis TaxID=2073169 RepID=A0A2S5DC07_9NEIS|nr:hypothetical protein [Chromobacterium alticapitis]POZ60630.1 hypothetical protein C2I19_17805 [Chromobacterium alticapitis]